jgi:hypothetical protein
MNKKQINAAARIAAALTDLSIEEFQKPISAAREVAKAAVRSKGLGVPFKPRWTPPAREKWNIASEAGFRVEEASYGGLGKNTPGKIYGPGVEDD